MLINALALFLTVCPFRFAIPDVTELLKEYKKLNEWIEDKSKKITINTIMIKVICEGLKEAPKMNCTLKFRRKLTAF